MSDHIKNNCVDLNVSGLSHLSDEGKAFHLALLRSLSDMGEGLVVIENNRFTYVNNAICRLTGYTEEELLSWPTYLRLIHVDERTHIQQNHTLRLAGEMFLTCYETALQHQCGHRVDVDISVSILEALGRKGVVITVRDITERKRDQKALFQEKELAQVTLRSIADGVITTDAQGCVNYLNPVAEQLTCWSNSLANGQPIERIFQSFNELTGRPVENPVIRVLHEDCQIELDNNMQLRALNGKRYSTDGSCSPIRTKGGEKAGTVLIFRDVTEERATASRMSYQASHDSLTGLVNRSEFERTVSLLLDDARNTHQFHSLLYLDFDKFKSINDECGHLAGDELLRQLAGILQSKLRKSDCLARLGGDEFGCLLVGCSINRAKPIAQSLVDAIQNFKFSWQGKQFMVGLSIGLIEVTKEFHDVKSLLNAADAACYLAKRNGRNRVHAIPSSDIENIERLSANVLNSLALN